MYEENVNTNKSPALKYTKIKTERTHVSQLLKLQLHWTMCIAVSRVIGALKLLTNVQAHVHAHTHRLLHVPHSQHAENTFSWFLVDCILVSRANFVQYLFCKLIYSARICLCVQLRATTSDLNTLMQLCKYLRHN